MNNKQNNNNCYVFSQATIDQAINEWIEIGCRNDAKNKEHYLITAEALPWFLKHFNHGTSIYTFTHENLLTELNTWKSSQLEKYPHQKKRIEETCDLLINFFQSEIVVHHKMTVQA